MPPKQRNIGAFQKWKSDCQGFLDTDFKYFRDTIAPLKEKRSWSEEDTDTVAELVTAGYGHALQQFLGNKHPAAVAYFKDTIIRADPINSETLEKEIRRVLESLKAKGWTQNEYLSFIEYLDSSKSIDDLAGDGEQSQKKDLFAEMYRSGSRAYKAQVIRAFVAAANAAPVSVENIRFSD